MRIGAIIPCRLDSTRLPAKVLATIKDKPLLWYVITRCRQVSAFCGNIVVATTLRSVDDRIVAYCKEEGVAAFRGDSMNVARRLLDCALEYDLALFCRANGDSPFLEPALIGQACNIAHSLDYDIVTNLAPRSFPYGVSVEIIKTKAFRSAVDQMWKPEHLEHVTAYFYENLRSFKYHNILRIGKDMSAIRMTVDTKKDLAIFRRVVKELGSQWTSLSYMDVVDAFM